MSKVTIKLDLDNLDDEMAHLRFVKSSDMSLVIWELSSNFRKNCEWAIDNKENCSANDALDIFMDKFHELLEDHDINPDKLTY